MAFFVVTTQENVTKECAQNLQGKGLKSKYYAIICLNKYGR